MSEYERVIASLLSRQGFLVFQTIGSEPVDLIAIINGIALLVEVKEKESISVRPSQEKYQRDLARRYGCLYVVIKGDQATVYTNTGYFKVDIELLAESLKKYHLV